MAGAPLQTRMVQERVRSGTRYAPLVSDLCSWRFLTIVVNHALLVDSYLSTENRIDAMLRRTATIAGGEPVPLKRFLTRFTN